MLQLLALALGVATKMVGAGSNTSDIGVTCLFHKTPSLCRSPALHNPLLTYLEAARAGRRTYVHIPKTGGKSVEVWFQARGIETGHDQARHGHFPWSGAAGVHSSAWAKQCEKTPSKHPMATLGQGCCSDWHIPPREFANFAAETPLLVGLRDPVERVRSQGLWGGASAGLPCTSAASQSQIINQSGAKKKSGFKVCFAAPAPLVLAGKHV